MTPERRTVWQSDQKDLRKTNPGAAAPEDLWLKDLMCHAIGLSYDYGAKIGRLDLPPFNRPHGEAVVDLFRSIDPNVRRIYAMSETPEYSYVYLLGDEGSWEVKKAIKEV